MNSLQAIQKVLLWLIIDQWKVLFSCIAASNEPMYISILNHFSHDGKCINRNFIEKVGNGEKLRFSKQKICEFTSMFCGSVTPFIFDVLFIFSMGKG